MSSSPGVYVGPYAMWVGEWQRDPEPDELQFFDALCLWGANGKAEIEFEAGAISAVLYTPPPESRRRGGPKRALSYLSEPDGGVAALELQKIDRDAEVEAFRKAYARELAVIAEVAGHEPVIRWGVIFTCD